MNYSHKRYFIILMCSTLAGLGAIVALNFFTDPFGVYWGFTHGRVISSRAGIGSRVSIAERLRQDTYDTLLVGTSRVANGLNAQSPELAGRRVLNVGMPGANFNEIPPIFDYATQQPSVKEVILCVDFFQFSGREKSCDNFNTSLFHPQLSALEYHAEKLLSARSCKDSLGIIKRALRNKPQHIVERNQYGEMVKTGIEAIDAPVVSPSKRRLAFENTLKWYLTTPHLFGKYQYNPESYTLFLKILQLARQRNIKLHIVISPVHAMHLKYIHKSGLWETYEGWKQDLVQAIHEEAKSANKTEFPLWDFTSYCPYTTEAVDEADDRQQEYWFGESSHYKTKLGDKILNRILHGKAAEYPLFGKIINLENLYAHLANLRIDRQQWCMTQPIQAAWVARLAEEAGKVPVVMHASQKEIQRR